MTLLTSSSSRVRQALDRLVEVLGHYSNQDLRGSLARLAKKLAAVRADGGPQRQPTTCRQRPRRPGWVLKARRVLAHDRGLVDRQLPDHRARHQRARDGDRPPRPPRRSCDPLRPRGSRRIQSVVATVCVWGDRRCSSSASAGVRQPRVLRGLLLSVVATASSSSAVCLARFVPLGKYWRSRPLVFSFVPRCQGL